MSSQLPRLGSWGIGGISQMTSAAQSLLGRATRSGQTRMMGSAKRKRGKKKAASASGAKKRRRKSKGKSKLKKGSAAAKAYMAKIRKMRK
jgi:hypothetical protein